jgi:hypothetical protein
MAGQNYSKLFQPNHLIEPVLSQSTNARGWGLTKRECRFDTPFIYFVWINSLSTGDMQFDSGFGIVDLNPFHTHLSR